jgi:hypothetical protein
MNPGDRIESDVRAIALPRGRRVGQPGHDIAREYLIRRMTEIGLEPFTGDSFELPFEREGTRFTNLVGVIPGSNRNLPPVLVGAHYDSVIDAPCADDNATSVAVALAAAETFAREPLQRDVVIAIFDSEEPPYFLSPSMGSTRFYEDHCADVRFKCVLIMDLIGHDVELGLGSVEDAFPYLKDLIFVTGAESDPGRLPGCVQRASYSMGNELRVIPTLTSYVGDLSDYHAFRLGGEPYLFLSCGRGPYYHHVLDSLKTPGWINLDKVHRVFQLVVELLREADACGPDAVDESNESAVAPDTLEFEIRLLEQALEGLLPALLGPLGLEEIQSREDFNRLASVLGRVLVDQG